MLRPFSRLILFIIVSIKNFVFKFPGASLGFVGGVFVGFVLGFTMVRFGFPGWVLPVNTIVWAITVAPVVKNYLDGLR